MALVGLGGRGVPEKPICKGELPKTRGGGLDSFQIWGMGGGQVGLGKKEGGGGFERGLIP